MEHVTKYPQKLLFISDEHKGGILSNFGAYQKNILALLGQYDRIIWGGDNWELFIVDKSHVQMLSHLLQDLTETDGQKWKKEFRTDGSAISGVKNVTLGATLFYKELIKKHPHIMHHVVEGNHEHVLTFRHALAKIQAEHPFHFEFSPEAVRVGTSSLVTHGHYPLEGKIDRQVPLLGEKEAASHQKWGWISNNFAWPYHHLWYKPRLKNLGADTIDRQLKKWAEAGQFSVSHAGKCSELTTQEIAKIRHVFFGHTHVKGHNLAVEGSNITFHNPGSVVHIKSQKPEDLGILEAELNADGTITNIRPVKGITKDPTPLKGARSLFAGFTQR